MVAFPFDAEEDVGNKCPTQPETVLNPRLAAVHPRAPIGTIQSAGISDHSIGVLSKPIARPEALRAICISGPLTQGMNSGSFAYEPGFIAWRCQWSTGVPPPS
jgi:hypothetical protein